MSEHQLRHASFECLAEDASEAAPGVVIWSREAACYDSRVEFAVVALGAGRFRGQVTNIGADFALTEISIEYPDVGAMRTAMDRDELRQQFAAAQGDDHCEGEACARPAGTRFFFASSIGGP